MHFFIHTLQSALLIILAVIVVPGVTIISPIVTLEIAVAFGLLNRTIKNVLEYFEIPANTFYLALFAVVVNGFLVAWTSLIQPGIFVRGIVIAVPFITLLTIGNVLVLSNKVPIENILENWNPRLKLMHLWKWQVRITGVGRIEN